ncbi:hypothetical protein ACQKMD_01220 [Viridibacillus sp. NPDC096237]|uniref:hypothetical protein n=1 Tax=Viridibacillus sp. NPDC096237 TaxID=3390721 RepID=UPI003D02A6F5
MEYIDENHNLLELQRELDELNRYAIEIGIFGSDDSFYAMLAGVHEFGMQIRAKNKYLAIPTKEAGTKRPRDFEGLFKPKGKNVLALADGNGGIKVMFILKESVNIPERSFIRSTFDEKNDAWMDFLEDQIQRVCELEITSRDVFENLGSIIAGDIQKKMIDLRSPSLSGFTKENRKNGGDNPLVDTGGLKRHVTWKVVRDDGSDV